MLYCRWVFNFVFHLITCLENGVCQLFRNLDFCATVAVAWSRTFIITTPRSSRHGGIQIDVMALQVPLFCSVLTSYVVLFKAAKSETTHQSRQARQTNAWHDNITDTYLTNCTTKWHPEVIRRDSRWGGRCVEHRRNRAILNITFRLSIEWNSWMISKRNVGNIALTIVQPIEPSSSAPLAPMCLKVEELHYRDSFST